MKKTLFLTAILGAALCGAAFGEEVTITQSSGQVNLSQYGSTDTVTLNVTEPASGNSAYLENGDSVTYNANLVIESLYLNNGWSKANLSYLFNGEITGSGNVTRTSRQSGQIFNFSGDMTGYTGTISMDGNATGDSTNRLVLTGNSVGAATLTTTNKAQFETEGTVTLNGTTVTAANTFIRANSALILDGTTTATLGNLTFGDGASITVGDSGTLDLQSDSTWTATGEETPRTSGNGFGTIAVTKDFGTSLVNNGTITVNGGAATLNDGVVSGTGFTTTYYVNEGVNISSLPGATKLIVNSTDGGVNQLGMSNSTYGNMDIVINGGRVITAHNNGTGFTTGDVTVNGGGTLAIVESGQDALGWGGNATKSISLLGESADEKATLELSYTGTGSVTLATALNLGGHSQVNGDRSFNTYGGTVTAEGVDNTISAGVVLRTAGTFNVKEGAELLISGAVTASTEGSAAYTMNKTGNGVLTISGAISGSTNGHRSVINGDGANTILSGTSIADSTLNNVTLTNSGLTLTGTMAMNDVTLRHALVNNSTLTLSGTVNYTGELVDSGTVARTEGNGLGFTTAKGTLISRGSGSTNKDAVTAWQVNGDSTGVSYADGALTKITGDSDIYYINNQGAALTAQKTGTLNAGTYTDMTAELVVGTNGAAEGVTLTVDGTTEVATTRYVEVYHNSTLNLEDTAHVSANSGSNLALWMHSGSTVNMAAGATVSADGVDFKGGTITATGDTQIGGSMGTPSNATITGSAITVNDNKTLRGHNVAGGSITTKGNATINAALSNADKTDLLVTSDSTANFSAGNVDLKNVTLEAGSTVEVNNHNGTLALDTLTVTGSGAAVNANLDLTSALVTLNGNVLTLGCDLNLTGTKISLDAEDCIKLEGFPTLDIPGQDVDLFNDVETVTLGSTTYNKADGFYMTVEDAGIHLVTGDGSAPISFSVPVYVKYSEGAVSLTTKVPEPATATLSLLALAALASRRRRH